MSIIITNVGYTDYKNKTCQYVIRINNGPILGTFLHDRPDGLHVCLKKASEAIEYKKFNDGGGI